MYRSLSTSLLVATALLTVSNSSYADTGWVYHGDINQDGIADTIQSGPSALFGNAGGPFMISLSQANGAHINRVVPLHPKAIALEMTASGPNYLWSYWRQNNHQGYLYRYSLDGKFTKDEFIIHPGLDGSELSTRLYRAVFHQEYLLPFLSQQNYTAPDYDWGK